MPSPISFVRPIEVIVRTGPARELLTPANLPTDEGFQQALFVQLPAEVHGAVERSRSLEVHQVTMHDKSDPDDRVKVTFKDPEAEPFRVGVDESVTVHLVKFQVF